MLNNVRTFFYLLEPVASTGPRVPPTAMVTILRNPVHAPMALLCNAQGHPVPSYRWV